MSTYTYEAFWREQGATEWNRITSSSPITWTQEVTQSSPYPNGQCSGSKYRVTLGGRQTSGASWTTNRTVWGPISGARIFSASATNHQVQLNCRGVDTTSTGTCATNP